jgi:hypothetical protein
VKIRLFADRLETDDNKPALRVEEVADVFCEELGLTCNANEASRGCTRRDHIKLGYTEKNVREDFYKKEAPICACRCGTDDIRDCTDGPTNDGGRRMVSLVKWLRSRPPNGQLIPFPGDHAVTLRRVRKLILRRH